jgi:hypothetical protein
MWKRCRRTWRTENQSRSQTVRSLRPPYKSWRTEFFGSKLNDVTQKDCFPLPKIDDMLDMLTRAKCYRPWNWNLTDGMCPCTLTTTKRQHSLPVKGYGTSQLFPPSSETLSWRSPYFETFVTKPVWWTRMMYRCRRTFQEQLDNLRKVLHSFQGV